MTTRRHRAALGAVSMLLLAGTAFATAPAAASQGSVPPEVSAYAADPGGLRARLNDLFGPGPDGRGIDFDDTTAVGQLNRAFVFSAAFLAGESTDIPIQLANEWTAPISIAEQPVGLAVIWINQSTIDPELADFAADPEAATALSDVPADAALVHDADRQAWFTLTGNELVPLVSGTSGVSEPTTLGRYQQRVMDAAADAPHAQQQPVPTLAVWVIVASLVVIVGVLVWPIAARRLRRTLPAPETPPAAAAPEAAAAVAEVAEPKPEPNPEPKPKAAATKPKAVAPKAPAAKDAAPKAAVAKTPAPKTPAAEPAAPKTAASKTPARKSAATKPVGPGPELQADPAPASTTPPKAPRKRPAPKPKVSQPEA